MNELAIIEAAFLDELEKIAVSKAMMAIGQTRSGRRPMTVDTLLRKEKDGSLYKETATLSNKRPGDVPSRDDSDPGYGDQVSRDFVPELRGVTLSGY